MDGPAGDAGVKAQFKRAVGFVIGNEGVKPFAKAGIKFNEWIPKVCCICTPIVICIKRAIKNRGRSGFDALIISKPFRLAVG
ncbi:MAG: hypothetical protein WCH96_13075, partial [Betaproteobacteria bacterium]